MNNIWVLRCVVPASLMLSACAVPIGPAYDSAQDNPKNALPESIVLRETPTTVVESQPITDQSAAEYENYLLYQRWRNAKQAHSADYKEFLEYQQWLLFKQQSPSAGGS